MVADPLLNPSPEVLLEVDIVVRRRDFTVAVELSVLPGEVVGILGPNGAGKSTLLSVIAGLLIPNQGRVVSAGRVLTSTSPNVFVAPQSRRIGVMGQDPLLFPHLTALENVAFGPRSQGRGRVGSRKIAQTWLERLGLAEFGGRKPAQLSGGQRQRVALARALSAEPDVLLLDEPLGALDVTTAPGVRQVLRTYLRETGTTTLLVTHDVIDAAVLADRALVLQAGQIVDSGPTARVLTAPRSEFSAALAGLNLLEGTAATTSTSGATGSMITVDGTTISGIAGDDLIAGAPARAVFRPAAVAVYLSAPVGSPRNVFPALVGAVEAGLSVIRLRTTGGIAADVTPAAVTELDLMPGTAIVLSVKATEVQLFGR